MATGRASGRDPISWTPSPRWIRWPAWPPRPRRGARAPRFDDDFKAQAVRLVLDEGKSVGAVARDLDLTESALRQWVERARADRTSGRTGLTTAERDELAKLRKENRELRMERDILTKVHLYTGVGASC